MEFSELAISRLKYGDGLRLVRDPEVLNQMLEYDQGIARCKTMYEETQRYFHVMEAGQKEVLNLSLCKDFVFAVEADLDICFCPPPGSTR